MRSHYKFSVYVINILSQEAPDDSFPPGKLAVSFQNRLRSRKPKNEKNGLLTAKDHWLFIINELESNSTMCQRKNI